MGAFPFDAVMLTINVFNFISVGHSIVCLVLMGIKSMKDAGRAGMFNNVAMHLGIFFGALLQIIIVSSSDA